jgi:MATE family multidrug resistance protein
LFGRLLKYGGPNGIQMFLDVLAFTLFTFLVGRLGAAEMGATSVTITFNMVAFLPMIGLGQAVCILVGQRLGENKPELAERSTITGLRWMFGYILLVAIIYISIPHLLLSAFASERDPEKFAAVAAIVPNLLICVAIYSLADSMNLSYSFALRGAGDTRFVTWLTFTFAWPLMVIPTYLVVTYREDLRSNSLAWEIRSTGPGDSRRRISLPCRSASGCASARESGRKCG